MTKPIGTVTRGTTHPNRLRRVDRWIAFLLESALRHNPDQLIVDLGFGATGTTPAELHARLRKISPRVRTLGLEIDPARVAAAETWRADGLDFTIGGFEVPTPGNERPLAIRAYNVLRQYDPTQVGPAWARMVNRLAPGGFLIEGTCDEIGKTCVWVTIEATGSLHSHTATAVGKPAVATAPVPSWLTISVDTSFVHRPSQVADRLPKVLIHRNVEGTAIHHWLKTLDRAWNTVAPVRTFSAKQRWVAMCRLLKEQGEPVAHGPHRWKLGEISVPWSRVCY